MALKSLGSRMKEYEAVSDTKLMRRSPAIIRVDGKAFHSFLRGFKKPFDNVLIDTMDDTAMYLCKNVQGCVLAYVQSDEISLLLVDYQTLSSDSWFENRVQKMVSISASLATMGFNRALLKNVERWKANNSGKLGENVMELASVYDNAIERGALFDSRVFSIPKEDVNNYFVFRQQDATRNSIQMVAQHYYSPSEIHGKNNNVLQDMLFREHGVNWNSFETGVKRGRCVRRLPTDYTQLRIDANNDGARESSERFHWQIDKDIPIFTQDHAYIEKLVFVGE